MKKYFVWVLAVLLLCSCMGAEFVFAADTGAVLSCTASERQVSPGDELTVTVSLKNAPAAKSMSLVLDYDITDTFTLVSGAWLLTGAQLTSFDTSKVACGVPVIAYSSETDMNGTIFEWKMKVKDTAPAGTKEITVTPAIRNGASVIACTPVTLTVQVVTEAVPVTGIALDKTTATVAEGNTVTLTPVFTPETATNKNVTWTTSDASVATVENGVVTGIKRGTAAITVKTEDGNYTASCVVYVEQAVAYEMPFTDVKKDDFFYDSVMWAVMNHITCGIDETHFGSDISCTRAQMVTFLWRAAGSPEPTKAVCPFTDVKRGEYYYKAVLWAVEKEITKGTSATTFSPDVTCTRGQTVTFLYRFAGQPTVSAQNIFTDVKSGEYYYDAVLWAIKNGITKGTGKTTFAPNDICTRAQIVTFLYRDLAKQP